MNDHHQHMQIYVHTHANTPEYAEEYSINTISQAQNHKITMHQRDKNEFMWNRNVDVIILKSSNTMVLFFFFFVCDYGILVYVGWALCCAFNLAEQFHVKGFLLAFLLVLCVCVCMFVPFFMQPKCLLSETIWEKFFSNCSSFVCIVRMNECTEENLCEYLWFLLLIFFWIRDSFQGIFQYLWF